MQQRIFSASSCPQYWMGRSIRCRTGFLFPLSRSWLLRRNRKRETLNGISHNLACNFVFPRASLLQRPIEKNCSWMLAINNTAATVPALIGMQYDWRAALVGIGNKHIHLAYIHTRIASDAEIRIENDRRVRSCDVRQSAYLYLSHRSLPIFPYKLQCSPYCEPRSWLSYRPNNSKAIRRI